MNHDLIAQVFQTLGELSGKMDTIIANDSERSDKIKNLEQRVGELEKLRAHGKGVVAAVAAVSSIVSAVVFNYIGK